MQRRIPENVRTRRLAAIIATTAVTALLAAGCSSSAPSAPAGNAEEGGPLEELVKAAQEEGELVVYGSPGEPGLKAAVETFAKKYGINASYVRLVGGDLESRYASEKEAGAPTADAIVLNLSAFTPDALEKGLVTPPAELDIPGYPGDFPEQFLLPEYDTAVVGLQVRGITYNTNFVKEGEIDEWSDLLDPKYKGHIGVPDPASAAVYVGHWYTIGEEQEGGAETFLTDVGAQLASNAVYASGVPASAAVGAGEVWIVPMNIASTTKTVTDQGAPLEFIVPEVTSADQQVVFANSEPKNPNAAKLWVSFMMSEEGAGAMAENNNETSPFDADSLPDELLSWPIEIVDEQKSNVVTWLTGK